MDEVGADENFFEIGGDSIMSIQITARAREAGIGLAPNDLMEHQTVAGLASIARRSAFEAPTIEALSDRVRSSGSRGKWTSLVPIRHGASRRTPLCILHGPGGHILPFRRVMEHLKPDRKVYGLQSVSLDGEAAPLSRIEDMVTHYLGEVLRYQPEGPYALAGICFGGVLAYEMACRLHALGHEVALVAMIDAVVAPRWLPVAARFRYGLGSYHRQLREGARRTAFGPDRRNYLKGRAYALVKQLRRRRWQRDFSRYFPGETDEGFDLPEALRNTREANILAMLRYTPNRYPGRLTVLRSAEITVGTISEPSLGWSYLADGGVDVIECPGDHWTIVLDSNAATVGKHLERLLEATEETKTQ
jgi:thioesterase domain-containing protein/aryl carrier-like protein